MIAQCATVGWGRGHAGAQGGGGTSDGTAGRPDSHITAHLGLRGVDRRRHLRARPMHPCRR
eukprot:3020709-Rhodomonas_salina.1